MIKWTTPTLKCEIPDGVQYDYILLTLCEAGSDTIVEKRIEKNHIIDGIFTVTFTQEETSRFNEGSTIEAQLNIIDGETRLATNVVELKISKNLHNSLIE